MPEIYTREDAINLILNEVEEWDQCDMIKYIQEFLSNELEGLEATELENMIRTINPDAQLEN